MCEVTNLNHVSSVISALGQMSNTCMAQLCLWYVCTGTGSRFVQYARRTEHRLDLFPLSRSARTPLIHYDFVVPCTNKVP